MRQQWIRVAGEEEFSDETAKEVMAGGRVLAIFRHDGQWFALDGMCAHQGGPIASGSVAHGCVTCPWHGWQYELATGVQTINRQPLQETFEVRCREGAIEVLMESAGGEESPRS